MKPGYHHSKTDRAGEILALGAPAAVCAGFGCDLERVLAPRSAARIHAAGLITDAELALLPRSLSFPEKISLCLSLKESAFKALRPPSQAPGFLAAALEAGGEGLRVQPPEGESALVTGAILAEGWILTLGFRSPVRAPGPISLLREPACRRESPRLLQ